MRGYIGRQAETSLRETYEIEENRVTPIAGPDIVCLQNEVGEGMGLLWRIVMSDYRTQDVENAVPVADRWGIQSTCGHDVVSCRQLVDPRLRVN